MEEQKEETIRMYVNEEPEKSKRYSFHMNSLKWLLAIVLIALMSTTLGITSHINFREINTKDCIQISTTNQQTNSTLCQYVKQFDLTGGYYATVCSYAGRVRLDLRQFIDGKATIEGIALDTKQWNELKMHAPAIESPIQKAEETL